MINTALLRPGNIAIIAAVALVTRFLFDKAFKGLGTSPGGVLSPSNPAGPSGFNQG